jgi:2-hydroxychromene-2-carboxylate isomerase
MKNIDYFFDFLSPYSYFSWKNQKQFMDHKNVEINIKPVVMGTLFSHWGIKGPGEITAKRYYELKQCFIYAAKNNIQFVPPKNHPFNPLYALRLATKECSGVHQKQVIDLLFNDCWAKGKELSEPDDLVKLLNDNDLPGTELIDKTFERDVKKQLKQNTKDAISDRVFGVPTFSVKDTNEIFWGNDSIENLNLYLTGNFPNWNENIFETRISDIKFD